METDKSVITNFQENFLLVASYINDITSSYYNENIFEELHGDMLMFCNNNRPIMLMGDLSGRTGAINDVYEDPDLDSCTSIRRYRPPVAVPIRKNCDNVINSHGEKFIKFCHIFDFLILNGRLKGDEIGNFTHLNNNNGPSTIDFSLCNNELYESIEKFMILPLSELSDHSKIITVFKESVVMPDETTDNYNWKTLSNRFKWESTNVNEFKSSLLKSQTLIDEISQRIEGGLITARVRKYNSSFLVRPAVLLGERK